MRTMTNASTPISVRLATRHQRPIALLLASAAVFAACGGESKSNGNDPNLYVVSREDLPVTVKEPGELQAVRETIVRSEVEGQSTILYLIPEGSSVKQGEKLFELDVSELVEKRANQEISVEKARNAWEQARTAGEILEKELTTKLNSANSQLRIARMELEKLLGAEGNKGAGKNADMVRRLRELTSEEPQKPTAGDGTERLVSVVDPRSYANLVPKVIELLRTPEGGDPMDRDMGDMANRILQNVDQIRIAMADLKNKEDYAAYSRRLAQKQFITRIELEKDELAYQSQLSKVTIAWNDLDLLINYELQADRIKMAQDYDNAQLELQRVEASNDAERKKSLFDIEAKKKEYEVAAERLQNFNKQIDNAICYAPTPGLVVYARVDRDRRGGEAIREGLQVRERQEIIILPDNSQMRCVVKVQEAFVDKVMVGQRAHVSVEAFPNEILAGKVVRVAPVADSASSWGGNDKKVYTTVVELDGINNDNRLRSRMAAAATITIDTVPNVITVPQQSVRRDRSVNYVWKSSPQGPVAQRIRVGSHNLEKVQIVEGIVEGDVVYRTPPGGVAEPKFDQPVVPEAAAPAATDGGQPATGTPPGNEAGPRRRTGEAGQGDASGQAPGAGAGPGAGVGQPGGRTGGRQGGMTSKKFVEMTPEELEAYKGRLDGMQQMADRIRDTAGEDTAKQMEDALAGIRKALDGNDLEGAQVHADKMRTLMRAAMGNRGGQGGAGAGPGGGQGGPGGGQGRGGRGGEARSGENGGG